MKYRVLLLVVGSLAVLAFAVSLTGVTPLEALKGLIQGSLGSPGAISGTLKETTPLLIAGLAVFIALRGGLFNIGVEGQFLVGAIVCAAIALRIPGVLGMVVGAASGMGAGALWALPAGIIKAYKGGHEVITTIMLNSVAIFLTGYLVGGPLKAPGQENTTTAALEESSRLPHLWADPPLYASSALLLAVLLVVGFAVWQRRTSAGYELDLVGSNPRAASLAGVKSSRVVVGAMTVSGAVGGLAGAVHVLAYEGRFYAGFSSGYGFDALGVALLAAGQPLALLPSAALFGILSKGSTAIQILGVPKGISTVVLGLVIVVFAAVRYRRVTHEAD